MYEKGEYAHARLELKNAIQIDPNFVLGYYYLGLVELKIFDFNKAFAAFSSAVDLDNDLWQAQLELGRLYLAATATEKALEKAELVLMKTEGNLQAIQLKAAAMLQNKKFTTAEMLLKTLIKNGHSDADTYLLLATSAVHTKNFERAEKLLKKGILANPDSIKLLTMQTGLLMIARRFAEAEIAFKRIMEIEPEAPSHLFKLVDFYWQTNRKKEALQKIGTALGNAPDNTALRIRAARFYQNRNEFKQAEKILTKGSDTPKDSLDIWLALSELYLYQNRLEKAQNLLEECQALSPDKKGETGIRVRTLLAQIAMIRGDFEAAEATVNSILDSDVDNADAHFIKAKIYLMRWQSQAAIAEFKTVIALMPGFESAHLNLTQAYLQNKNPHLGLNTLKQAIEYLPGAKKLRQALAKVHIHRKEYASAENLLRQLVDYWPLDPDSYIALGDFFLATKQFEKAEKVFQEFIRFFQEDSRGYLKLSQVYANQGNPRAAVSILKNAYLNHKADSAELLSAFVQRCLDQKDDAQAILICNQRLAKNSEDHLALNLRGVIYTHQRRYHQALSDFNKAIALSPQWSVPHANLARLYLEKGAVRNAIRQLESALQWSPADINLYLSLAGIYAQKKNYKMVIQVYEHALKTHPEMWSAANNLAFYLVEYQGKSKDLQRALTLVRRAQFYRPFDLLVEDTLAWIFYRQGKVEKAHKIMQHILIQAPENPVFNYHMGTILAKSGFPAKAREKLIIALDSKEEFAGREDARRLLDKIDKDGLS